MISTVTVGSRMLTQNQRYEDIRTAFDTTRQALSSGKLSLARIEADGSLPDLYSTRSTIRALDADQRLVSILANRLEKSEVALGQIQEVTKGFATLFADATTGLIPGKLENVSSRAETLLSDVFSTLNVAPGGRALFAGGSVDQRALQPSSELLDDLRTLITTSTDVEADLDRYFFHPAGGFETGIWNGTAASPPPVTSSGDVLASPPTAAEPELRILIRGLALSAIASDPAVVASPVLGTIIENDATANLISGERALVELREQLGLSQERVEHVSSRVSASQTSTALSINSMESADPFETATRLTELEIQLEAFYATTARLSQLRFTDYI